MEQIRKAENLKTKKCAFCDVEIVRISKWSSKQWENKRFCSIVCQQKGKTKTSFIPWNKRKRVRPLRKCDACGVSNKRIFFCKKFSHNVCDRHYWHLKLYGRFLSEDESKENLKRAQSRWIGKRPANYKGGRATLNTVIRRCVKYKQWVKTVFIGNDFTCQKCFIKGTYLEADHFPDRFSVIMDEEGITTYEQALACERLWDTENGRTLCRKCHRGNGINNKATSSNIY